MPGHGERLSRKREQLVSALLAKPTIKAAAESIGISEKTARNWLADPTFLKAYRSQRRQLVEGATARVQAAMSTAVDTLLELVESDNERLRLEAAKFLFEHGREALDKDDVLERLEALEARLFGPQAAASTNGALR
jgi:hypothetical protein